MLPADDRTQLRDLWGFPNDDNTGQKSGPGHDRGHIFQSVSARPPPQGDSLCVGSDDLSRCDRTTLSHSQSELTSSPSQQLPPESDSFHSQLLRLTETETTEDIPRLPESLPDATLVYLPFDAEPNCLLEGCIVSGFSLPNNT